MLFYKWALREGRPAAPNWNTRKMSESESVPNFQFVIRIYLLKVREDPDAEVVPHEVSVVVVPPVLVARPVRAGRHERRLVHELHVVVLVQAELVRRVVDLARADLEE